MQCRNLCWYYGKALWYKIATTSSGHNQIKTWDQIEFSTKVNNDYWIRSLMIEDIINDDYHPQCSPSDGWGLQKHRSRLEVQNCFELQKQKIKVDIKTWEKMGAYLIWLVNFLSLVINFCSLFFIFVYCFCFKYRSCMQNIYIHILKHALLHMPNCSLLFRCCISGFYYFLLLVSTFPLSLFRPYTFAFTLIKFCVLLEMLVLLYHDLIAPRDCTIPTTSLAYSFLLHSDFNCYYFILSKHKSLGTHASEVVLE